MIVICSGHTLLFEDSINLAALLEKYGFPPPASDVNLTEEAKKNMQSKKHAVPDENYDEMGIILEPWRVSLDCHFKVNLYRNNSFESDTVCVVECRYLLHRLSRALNLFLIQKWRFVM